MVVTKDGPHGPGHNVPMFIVVKCEDHSAIQAPHRYEKLACKRLLNMAQVSSKFAQHWINVKKVAKILQELAKVNKISPNLVTLNLIHLYLNFYDSRAADLNAGGGDVDNASML